MLAKLPPGVQCTFTCVPDTLDSDISYCVLRTSVKLASTFDRMAKGLEFVTA